MRRKVKKKLLGYDFNLPLICNLCKGKYHPDKKRHIHAHSAYCDGTCRSHSGGNAILTVCFLSILGRGVVTAGRIFLTTAETTHHDHGWKKRPLPKLEVWLPITTSVVLAQGRSTLSRVLESSTERPWPCPQCWVVCCWLIILGQGCLLSAL